MRRARHLALVLLAALGAGAPARAADGPRPPVRSRLANGLTVVLQEDHRAPLVAVNVTYRVGPASEAPGQVGLAHLFEHLMFQGSEHVLLGHVPVLEAAGATSVNGTTDLDRTTYVETVPAHLLELTLWLESDRMGFLLPALTEEKLAAQRAVIHAERRETVEEAPYGRAQERLVELLYPAPHPYHGGVIGGHAAIDAATLAAARGFGRTFYAPANAVLTLVGDLEPRRARALVARYFGGLPTYGAPGVHAAGAARPAPGRAALTDRVALGRVYLGWRTPPRHAPGDAEADLLAHLLAGGRASRLHRRLVEERGLAQDVAAEQHSLGLGSFFAVVVTARPGVAPAAIEREVDAALGELREAPVTPDELLRAQRHVAAAFLRAGEALAARAARLGRYAIERGDPAFGERDLARYRAATAAGLQAFAREHLDPRTRVVVTVTPAPAAPAGGPPPRAP